jgi:hypothetical protein
VGRIIPESSEQDQQGFILGSLRARSWSGMHSSAMLVLDVPVRHNCTHSLLCLQTVR